MQVEHWSYQPPFARGVTTLARLMRPYLGVVPHLLSEIKGPPMCGSDEGRVLL